MKIAEYLKRNTSFESHYPGIAYNSFAILNVEYTPKKVNLINYPFGIFGILN